MNFPTILTGFSVVYSHLSALLQRSGQAFGHVWRTIHQMPIQLCQLILSVKDVVSECFTSVTNHIHDSKLKPSSQSAKWQILKEESMDKKLDLNLQDLYELNQDKINEKKVEIFSVEIDHNPLNSMDVMTQELDQDINDLKTDMLGAINTEEVEEKILTVIHGIVQPAKDLLNEIGVQKPKTWQSYLVLMERIEQKLDPLKAYASKFEKIPEGYQLVQSTMKALEDQTRALGKEMCVLVRRKYKPNPSICNDGHCLFWSIDDQLKKHAKPVYYRKLAADFIRKNSQEFESGIADFAASKQGRAKVAVYAKAQGGRQTWFDKLEKKLKRKPTKIDFYCDCLENSTMWGGTNEVLALSEQLQVPVLIFTRQNYATWRFDLMKGLSKFNGKPPILLYYNGTNHYQNLIPR